MADIIQLKITLKQSKPPIWRRVLLDKKSSFLDLHRVIQCAMGWHNCHLFAFTLADGTRITQVYEEFDWDYDENSLDASKLSLEEILKKEKEKIHYEYDFGDSWIHELLVEKFLPREAQKAYPLCIAGKQACPPEDCGGIWGFYSYLEVLQDLDDPEREEVLDWFGEDYDPTYFNLEDANQSLSTLR